MQPREDQAQPRADQARPRADQVQPRADQVQPDEDQVQAREGRVRNNGIRLPGIVLGIGMGGFADGILLHQVLQWHHLLTGEYPADTVDGLRMNTLGDGLFHTVTWLSVLVGLGLLHSRIGAVPGRVWRSRELWGWMFVGWGLFNLVEGIVDHHLLGIHHVRGGPYQMWWDLGFLVLGLVLMAGGWLLQRGAGDRR